MAVRLEKGTFTMLQGLAAEDFELLPEGSITLLPRVVGTGNTTLEAAQFESRVVPRGP